jgi:hypothetical protein
MKELDPLNPIYNPSVDDLAAGFVSLTITVNSIAPCVVPVSKSAAYQQSIITNEKTMIDRVPPMVIKPVGINRKLFIL